MTAIGFALFTVSMLVGWFAHDPLDKNHPPLFNWALGGSCTGLGLMAAGVTIWLWRAMP